MSPRPSTGIKRPKSGHSKKDEGKPTDAKLTLAEYLTATWLPVQRKQVRSTNNLEATLGKWVLHQRPERPYLGGMFLKKLKVDDFDRLYVAMAEQGIGVRGITYLHGILRKALKFAVKKHKLPHNPTHDATLPKPDVQAEITSEHDEEEGEVQYLNREQAVRFLAAAKTDRWSALWHLLLDAGLRPGEAFALNWRHVDFEKRIVKVRGTLTRIGVTKKKAGGVGWKITKPKTRASIGDVPVSTATVTELRRWKKQQAAERLQMGPEWQDHGFIFTTEFGTPLGNNMGRLWDRVLAKADHGKGDLGVWGPEPEKPRSGPTPQRTFTPGFPLYVLRHTSATLALLDGIDLLTVSRRLATRTSRSPRASTATYRRSIRRKLQRASIGWWRVLGLLRLSERQPCSCALCGCGVQRHRWGLLGPLPQNTPGTIASPPICTRLSQARPLGQSIQGVVLCL